MTKRARVGILGRGALGAALLVAAGVLGAPACGGSDTGNIDPGGGGTGGSGGATTTSTTSTTTGTGGQGGQDTGCQGDQDCTIDPAKSKCDQGTGECVGCLPAQDECDPGQYCDPGTNECTVGCTDDTDCTGGQDLHCDTQINKCVGCVLDTNCPEGSICINNTCTPGCSGAQPCQPGSTCCGAPTGTCYDLDTDVDHCGDCNTQCPDLVNADEICNNGQCGLGACTMPWADCDGDITNGCEQNTLQDGPCACNPGDTQPCYQGAPGTQNVGPCVGGTQTCAANGLSWGACLNQVLPAAEICANGVDEDCDGVIDNGGDSDADGWTICNGDCDDTDALVNPGAYEFVGNNVDDDCDPASSDVVAPADCSSAQKFTAVTGDDIAKAIDICQTTTANPPIQNKKWGLITAGQVLGNGQNPSATTLNNIQSWQDAVLQNYGVNLPKKGPTMGGLSSGRMRDSGDPGFTTPNGGTGFATPNACPPVYLAGNGGVLPSSSGCSGNCTSAQTCNDSTNVKLQIRVPTNAQSFSYQFKFYSAEFPEWVCTSYNDFYLALLQSAAPGIPLDTNISFDGQGNPFSVNNGFFDVCAPTGCHTCPDGVAELVGTGMEGGVGGGSKWLTTDAPIVPGETITIELMVFDVGDSAWDSLVLLDNFHWNLSPAVVGTHQ